MTWFLLQLFEFPSFEYSQNTVVANLLEKRVSTLICFLTFQKSKTTAEEKCNPFERSRRGISSTLLAKFYLEFDIF